ncbi:hypothetical protein LSUB1_G002181 [Lachnellula subtilissima]|uniref:Uncharacterized protein n=1 Tax=Lachnellula subtilissima TaxID=602034 RepID=A0A8H8RV67_9HELO|nr:hypothetical protein LSUB1_G002181 [Lachnellula subtilissima]
MWPKRVLPQFNDSEYPKDLKDPSACQSFEVDDEKSISDTSTDSKSRRLRTVFHHNRDPLPDHSDIYLGKTDWRSIGNLLLAIYATLSSTLSVAIAIWQPRYGKWIGPTGHLTPSTADLLFSLFAKSIEIASAGVYINFLGQFLTRRSLRSRGISLTDIAVREWLIQPGLVIFQWENLKYATTTILGFTSLLSAIAIYFFTTASNSLVSPHIALSNWESAQFLGQVQQNFGNLPVMKKECWAPIDAYLDSQNVGESCVNVLASGLANQDFNEFMKAWSRKVMGGNTDLSSLSSRPPATSSIFTDTMVEGNWVQRSSSDISANFAKYGRIVNNITLSMPHPVVFYSARVEFPKTVRGTGSGEHTIRASVLSPTSNTLCVNMQKSEIAPLVYVDWPHARFNTSDTGHKSAASDWFKDVPANISLQSNISQTYVEDIFRWGSVYNRRPPVFPQWPIDSNSIYNISVPKSDSIYLLLKSPNTTDYTVCQMYGLMSQNCSTKHTQKVGTRTLNSDCDGTPPSFGNTIAPGIFHPKPSTDFRDVLGAWATAVGLNGGMVSSNSSLIHTLSQLVVTNSNSSNNLPSFNTTLPSLSEGLAALSNSMLMKASINASFDNTTIKNAPIAPTFLPYNVIVQTQQYRSGPPARWQGILYPILIIMFAANWYCLAYFIREMGLVVDFLEPHNLFSAAIDSPSESKRKAPTEGPVGCHSDVAWLLRRDHHRRLVFRKARGEGWIGGGKRDGVYL